MSSEDLRSWVAELQRHHAREYLQIDDELSGDWDLTAITTTLESKLRVPVIHYCNIAGSPYSVMHNVCGSLSRLARTLNISIAELEAKLEAAYEALIPPQRIQQGPVRENIHTDQDVDLYPFPQIRYTRHETHPYISAACLVALDETSGALNLSFHRLMINSRNTLAIYMTPGADLSIIFENNRRQGKNTPVAAFIGAHPLWSLGSLSAGPLSLDEYSVIGGLMGSALPVVAGLHDERLSLPAAAEIALEGYLSRDEQVSEGPYGEAFGYTSHIDQRPVFVVQSVSHRNDAIFQDIVPGKMEHLTMTSVAIRIHLQRSLSLAFPWITRVHLPAPMMAYLSIEDGIDSEQVRNMLRKVLLEQRFVKYAVAFSKDVKLDSPKETQRALAMHTQADRDTVVIRNLPGNGLDPSERDQLTCKCGIDSTSTTVAEGLVHPNELPESVFEKLDIDDIIRRATGKS